MDKKNNDEKTFGEIFSNINTGNNDDKSISFNSIKEESNFYSKETGEVYDVNKTIRETDLKNGSRIILI